MAYDLNAEFPEWHPATFVGLGHLTGVQGAAKHVKGDTWRFAYIERTPLGPVLRERDVFRTAVDVRSVARRAA